MSELKEGKPKLEDLVIVECEIVDGRTGDAIDRVEKESTAELLSLALDVAIDAARLRDSIKVEQALGHLADYTDEFGKRFRTLDVLLKKAGYR